MGQFGVICAWSNSLASRVACRSAGYVDGYQIVGTRYVLDLLSLEQIFSSFTATSKILYMILFETIYRLLIAGKKWLFLFIAIKLYFADME